MNHLPLFANLAQQPCLVVGGGEVAARKVDRLLKAGARVTINAPELGAKLQARVAAGSVRYQAGEFDPALLAGQLLVIAATSERETNRSVAAAAAARRCLCNVVDDGELSSFIMPSVIDRSPVLIAISSNGTAPVLSRLLRQRIEDWLPSRIGALASWAGSWRERVRTRLHTHTERAHFWQDALDGQPAELLLGGNPTAADAAMATALDTSAAATAGRHTHGIAWLVGAGPGDPGLITRRGLQLLQRADVVMHDRLVPDDILEFARRDAQLVPVGKHPHGPSTSQAKINAQLVERVRRGERVCRLKGGDPYIFGRGAEEVAALVAAGLPYQVIPGVTAANGCAAAAGIPLTHREISGAVTIVTGHSADGQQDDTNWAALARCRHTLVVYMSVRRLVEISALLIELGRAPDTPAAIIENGTTERQRIIGGRLDEMGRLAAEAGVQPPALLIIGNVIDVADKLDWLTRTNLPAPSGYSQPVEQLEEPDNGKNLRSIP